MKVILVQGENYRPVVKSYANDPIKLYWDGPPMNTPNIRYYISYWWKLSFTFKYRQSILSTSFVKTRNC